MSQLKEHILIVDDHDEIRSSLSRFLRRDGFETSVAKSAAEMEERISETGVDLIVLDIMMPGEDGLSVCKRLRSRGNTTPIIMLTALGSDDQKIAGLSDGADDYLSKPFNPNELSARIRAVLRRRGPRTETTYGGDFAGKLVEFGGFTYRHDDAVVVNAIGTEVSLTTAEVRLLNVFLEHPRVVINRDRLLKFATGRNAGPLDRTIDNQVSRLRRKIEQDPSQTSIIATVRNGGYCLNCDVKTHPA